MNMRLIKTPFQGALSGVPLNGQVQVCLGGHVRDGGTIFLSEDLASMREVEAWRKRIERELDAIVAEAAKFFEKPPSPAS